MSALNNRSLWDRIEAMPEGENKERLKARFSLPNIPPKEAWENIRRQDQIPPSDPWWDTWIYAGGRGAGKTRTGVEEVCRFAESAENQRILIVARNGADLRNTIVEGESGILERYVRVNSKGYRFSGGQPEYAPSIRRLKWPNGSQAFLVAADDLLEYTEDHDSQYSPLRGVQVGFTWAEEAGSWTVPEDYGVDPQKLTLWDEIRFSTRLTVRPRVLVTTTPTDTPMNRLLHKQIEKDPIANRLTEVESAVNYHHMAPSFQKHLEEMYGGTEAGNAYLKGRWPYPH